MIDGGYPDDESQQACRGQRVFAFPPNIVEQLERVDEVLELAAHPTQQHIGYNISVRPYKSDHMSYRL